MGFGNVVIVSYRCLLVVSYYVYLNFKVLQFLEYLLHFFDSST